MTTNQPPIKELLVRGYRYAFALTNDRWDADELLAEACLAIVSARARWDEAYLLAAVRSKFVDHCRAAARGRKRAASANGRRRSPVEFSDPDRGLDEAEQEGRLERSLSLLRPDEREALYLHAVAGMTVQQIATMTGHPRSTVLSRLQRGRARILEQMQETRHEVRSDG